MREKELEYRHSKVPGHVGTEVAREDTVPAQVTVPRGQMCPWPGKGWVTLALHLENIDRQSCTALGWRYGRNVVVLGLLLCLYPLHAAKLTISYKVPQPPTRRTGPGRGLRAQPYISRTPLCP